jgi:putative flavoprotein involved in K+ transport
MHHRGVVASQPGQYFVGLSFLYAMPSGFLPGVDRDAEHVVVSILAGAERTSARPGQTADHRVRHPMGAG